jgi:hypothetical protein
VKSIEEHVFIGCSALTDVYCLRENPPKASADAFDSSVIGSMILHVPAVSLNKYSKTEPWMNFKKIVALTDQELSIGGIPEGNTTAEVERYTTDGRRANNNTRGLNIIRMSDGMTKKVLVR